MKNLLNPLVILTGGCLYTLVFWKQETGINLPIFFFPLYLLLWFQYPVQLKTRLALFFQAGLICSAVFYFLYHMGLAKVMFLCSFFLLTGLALLPEARMIFYWLKALLQNYLAIPFSMLKYFRDLFRQNRRISGVLSILWLSIIPIGVTFIFWLLYMAAIPSLQNVMEWIAENLEVLLDKLSIPRLIHLLFGALITAGIYRHTALTSLRQKSLVAGDQLIRVRKPGRPFLWRMLADMGLANHTTGLKKETLTGVILLFMVNLLLFVVNLLDISNIWINFDYDYSFSMAEVVHEGTFILIFSILLSMAILLFLFRGNQNFYQGNKLLKKLAVIWIAQNCILVISVVLRNYHYIHHFGVTHKRIGVYVFLILTLAGLITFYFKIIRRYSAYYLLRINSWIAYFLLIFLCTYDWDMMIARFNLENSSSRRIDYQHMLKTMPDRTLPILYRNQDQFKDITNWFRYESEVQSLNSRIGSFLSDYKKRKWPEWNWAEEKAYRKLKMEN